MSNRSQSLLFASLLALASGAAALGHQLLWTRRMVDLLGGHAESVARVFGGFFLGLALGAALAAWLAPRIRRPWRMLALAETGILLLAIPILLLPHWTGWIWPALGPEGLVGWPGLLVKSVLSLLLVMPPACLMGFFLPLLARALFGAERTLGREGLRLYGLNTLGGVLGLVLTLVWGLPWLGSFGSLTAVLLLNAVVALGCLWMDSGALPASNSKHPSLSHEATAARPLPLGLAFLSGFIILGSEIAGMELIGLVAPLSFQAPAIILILVISLLAVAALLTPALIRWAGSARQLLGPVLIASSLTLLLAASFYFFLAERLAPTGALSGQGEFLLRFTVFGLATLGPAFLVGGFLFPLCCAAADQQLTSAEAGRAWGRLLAINGLGGWLGAEVAYRFLLPMGGPYTTLGILALAYAGAALLRTDPRRWLARASYATAGAGLLLTLYLLPNLPRVNPHVPLRILHQESGREGSLAVVESPAFGRAILLSNQYLLGSTSDQQHQERLGHIPLLLHPNPDRAGFIALATGITAGAALHHEAVQEIEVVEISGAVNRAARRWFQEANFHLHDSPKVRVHIEDGRTWVAAHREDFDVLIGDLYLPWGPGEARLYSREHFQACREALRPGGLFCQWLPMHQLTRQQLDGIVASFLQVFDRAWLVASTFHSHAPSLGLIGFEDSGAGLEVLEERFAEQRAHLTDPILRSPELFSWLLLGRLEKQEKPMGRPQTLDNMWIELDAGQLRLTGSDELYLSGENWLELTASLVDENASSGQEWRNIFHQLARGEEPGEEVRVWLRELRHADPLADWRGWPGN